MRTTTGHSGVIVPVSFCVRSRRLNCINAKAIIAIIPNSSVELFIPVNSGPHSGKCPAPNNLSSCGAGTEMDLDIQITPPLKIIMPPSVVINPGMPSLESQNPCQAPASAPIARLISAATHHGNERSRAASANTMPEKPATEPTDKSI